MTLARSLAAVLAMSALEALTHLPARSTITGKTPARDGKYDLCLMFTSKSVDPTFAIDRVTLKPN